MIRSRRGGILIYMLGMIALLGIVITEFLMDVAGAIRYRGQVTHRDDLQVLAYSVLETTLAVLAEVKEKDKGLYSPLQDWGQPLKYAKFKVPEGYTVAVKMQDETGKLSIYQEDFTVFGNLMTEIGVSGENIGNLKVGLKKWLDKLPKSSKEEKPKGGAKEVPEQAEEEAPNKPEENKPPEGSEGQDVNRDQNQPGEKKKDEKKKEQRVVYNLLQLREIPAFEKVFFDGKQNPNEKFKLLEDYVSILNRGVVNINTAPEVVKRLLLGFAPLEQTQGGKEYYHSIAELGIGPEAAKELEKVAGVKVSVLNIGIEVARGTVKYYLNVIVKLKEGDTKGAKKESEFTFLALTEDGAFDR